MIEIYKRNVIFKMFTKDIRYNLVNNIVEEFLHRPKPTACKYCPPRTFHLELSLIIFKTCLLGRDFHTLIKNVSFSPTDVGSHNFT